MLTIAIPAFSRVDTLRKVLYAIKDTYAPDGRADDINVVVSIDHSPAQRSVVDLCNECGIVDRIILHNSKLNAPLGITRHVQWLMNFCLADSRYVLLLEDDVVPIGNWLQVCQYAMRQDVPFLALHPDLNPNYSIISTDINKVEITVRTSCWGVLLRRDVVDLIHRYTSFEEYSWDYAMNRSLDQLVNRSYFCKVPRVKHIGTIGQHFRGDEPIWKMLNNLYEKAEKYFSGCNSCAINLPYDIVESRLSLSIQADLTKKS